MSHTLEKAVQYIRIRYRRYDALCEDAFREAKELRDKINAELEEQDAERDENQHFSAVKNQQL